MYDVCILGQIIVIIFLFVIIHFIIEIELPDRCIVQRRGNYRDDLISQSKKEKGKMLYYSALISTILTVFTMIFFWISTGSGSDSIEISSIVLSAGGAIYVAVDSLSRRATYWDRMNTRPVAEDLPIRKAILIHVWTGLFLISYGFIIRLLLFIQ